MFKPSFTKQETEVGDNSKSAKVPELPGSATFKESETVVEPPVDNQMSDTGSIDLFDIMDERETSRNTESENDKVFDSFRVWMESADWEKGGHNSSST